MANLRSLMYQIYMLVVCIGMYASVCSASCAASDVTVLYNGNQAESDAWLATLKSTVRRPLHMEYFKIGMGMNFTGISIPDNDDFWDIEWGKGPVSYKGRVCAQWMSEHSYNSRKTVITMNQRCDVASQVTARMTATEFMDESGKMQAKGYVLKSFTWAYGMYFTRYMKCICAQKIQGICWPSSTNLCNGMPKHVFDWACCRLATASVIWPG